MVPSVLSSYPLGKLSAPTMQLCSPVCLLGPEDTPLLSFEPPFQESSPPGPDPGPKALSSSVSMTVSLTWGILGSESRSRLAGHRVGA